jgi:hypothetical protein
MSRTANPSTNLSSHQLDAIVSLQNREQRAEMMTMARAFTTLPAPISADWIKQLFQLENKLHRIIQNDKKWFFNNTGDPDTETFARDMHLLHSIAANSLASLIERRSEWSHDDNSESLRNAIAFQMYHYGAAIKWSFFSSEPISPTLWPQLHRLYVFAEQQQLHLQTAALFAEESEYTSSVTSLYIRALLLDVLNTGNLDMAQIEIADGWLAAWTSQYQFSSQLDTARLYVDFASYKGLQQVLSNVAPPPCRYLNLTPLTAQLDMVRDAMRLGKPYQGRGIPNLFVMEEHVVLLGVVERINTSMLSNTTVAIEPRNAVINRQVKVVFGLNEIYQALSGVTPASADTTTFAGFTLSLEPIAEEASPNANTNNSDATIGWALSDMSAKGMGFILNASAASRVATGQLLAIQVISDDVVPPEWELVSVARKIEERLADTSEDKNQTRLGTEIISTNPIAVSLRRNIENAVASTTAMKALFLPGNDARGRDDTLLLSTSDSNQSNPTSSFTLSTDAARFVIRLNRAKRKGNDWISFKFEVIEKL